MIILAATLAMNCLSQTGSATVALPGAPGPLDNPLKGYAAYSEVGTVHSVHVSMAFVETSWRELEPKEGNYAFADWEQRAWETPLAKGKPIAFRVYLDYPNLPVALPGWLISKGVKMTPYDEFGGGKSPDYENPVLRTALKKFIVALGKRYNSQSRVAYVQLGLLGHWGEWHTYPRENLFASPAMQTETVNAMHQAFPDKPIMARNPSYASCQLPWIGFHDDMIPADTLGPDAWDFLPSMKAAKMDGNWKVAPTGGEMVPGAAKQYLNADWPKLLQAVSDAHFTWIGPYCPALEGNLDATSKQRAEDLIRKLGYEFRWTSAQLPKTVTSGGILTFSLEGLNQGAAPFYFKWPVRIVLLSGANKVAREWNLQDDIRTWLPGKISVNTTVTIDTPKGAYRLAIGIVNPASGRAEIRFANALPSVSGYTVLSPLEVR